MKTSNKLVGITLLFVMLFLLTGCMGKIEVSVREDFRFPVGSRVYLAPSADNPVSIQLDGRIMNHLLANGYRIALTEKDADFYIGYGHAGGVTDYMSGIISVRGLSVTVLDRFGELVALGVSSGGDIPVDKAVAQLFAQLKDYQ